MVRGPTADWIRPRKLEYNGPASDVNPPEHNIHTCPGVIQSSVLRRREIGKVTVLVESVPEVSDHRVNVVS